jgi:hypothetical protein
MDARETAPSAERNEQPILEVLAGIRAVRGFGCMLQDAVAERGG